MARKILIVFTLSAAVPLVSGTLGGCLVQKYVEIKEPADTRILSFIKLDNPLHFIVQFKDQDLTYIRDWLELTNSRGGQAKVRGGTSNKTTHDLPLTIDEGWNKLHLQAVDKHFQLTLLLGEGDEATLLDLMLDHSIYSVHVEGTFSICSEGSPEWEVEAGKEVYVPLQPETNQQLQVTGRGNTDPYLVVPSASSDQPKDITANTTLTIKTRWRRSLITVEVFQGSIEDDEQALVKADMASPIVLMGVRYGTVHLRLDLSVPVAEDVSHSAGCADVSHSAGCAGTSIHLWPIGLALFCGGMVFVVLLAAVVLACRWCIKRKAKKATTPDAANFPSGCEKRTKRKAKEAATADEASFPSLQEKEPLQHV